MEGTNGANERSGSPYIKVKRLFTSEILRDTEVTQRNSTESAADAMDKLIKDASFKQEDARKNTPQSSPRSYTDGVQL